MSSSTRPASRRPVITAAAATAHDELPEAWVGPAPRSQIRSSIRPSGSTWAICTFVRLGNLGSHSSASPQARQGRPSRSGWSTKITQCGLPTDSTVTSTVAPATVQGAATTGAGASTGTALGSPVAWPISTEISPESCTVHATTSWPVNTVKLDGAARRSTSHRARMRRPLPDFSATEPSGFQIRTP